LPRLLFVLDGTAAAGVDERISALSSAAAEPDMAGFLQDVPVLAAVLTDILRVGPGAPVWRPVQDPGRRVLWTAGAAGQGSGHGLEEACAGRPSHCPQLVRAVVGVRDG
jgi:RecJ-like exonuclease